MEKQRKLMGIFKSHPSTLSWAWIHPVSSCVLIHTTKGDLIAYPWINQIMCSGFRVGACLPSPRSTTRLLESLQLVRGSRSYCLASRTESGLVSSMTSLRFSIHSMPSACLNARAFRTSRPCASRSRGYDFMMSPLKSRLRICHRDNLEPDITIKPISTSD